MEFTLPPLSLSQIVLLPHMLEQGCGHIVVISSLQGKLGLPFRSSCELLLMHTYFHATRSVASLT